jgi:recombination protein RecR
MPLLGKWACQGRFKMESRREISAIDPVLKLIQELNKLPGIGIKTAQRLAFHLIKIPNDSVSLANAIIEMTNSIKTCIICQNITDISPCKICNNPSRNNKTICVVEEPLDVLAIERTGSYSGLYHVLNGCISPTNGIGPDELTIKLLLERLRLASENPNSTVEEIILATNSNLEGEATSMYLQHLMQPFKYKITRIARGLPTGAELEYADEATITKAMEGRYTL